MAKKKRRRPKIPGPFRKVVPFRETWIGALLLVFLGGVAALLLWKRGKWDSTVLDPVTPEPRMTGLLNTIPERMSAPLVGAGATRAPNEAKRSRLEDLAGALPSSFQKSEAKRTGAIEYFPESKLYVKIDGRAEIYVQHKVVGLACASFETARERTPAEIFLYLMQTPKNAFGVYAAERPEGAAALPVGDEGYLQAESCYFRKGPVYAQVLGGEGWKPSSVRAFAEELASLLPASSDDAGLGMALSRLPSDGQVPATTRYEPTAAFGIDALSGIWFAKYSQGKNAPSAYLWFGESDDEAKAKSMHDGFLKGLGRRAETLPPPRNEDLADASFRKVGSRVHCVFRWGRLVGGVMDAKDRASCESLVDRLMAAIDEAEQSMGENPETGEGKGKER